MKKSLEFISHSKTETQDFGKNFGVQLNSSAAIGLVGEIGTGKTEFVRGLASGLGIDTLTISSPTFTLVNEHQGRLNLYHLDIYRLSHYHEVLYLGFNDFLSTDSVVVIEWYDKVEKDIAVDYRIDFFYMDENVRKLFLSQKTSNEKRNYGS
jgi:tRNA threonylcarbamoyladenosine biosynthesis protein TsaE